MVSIELTDGTTGGTHLRLVQDEITIGAPVCLLLRAA